MNRMRGWWRGIDYNEWSARIEALYNEDWKWEVPLNWCEKPYPRYGQLVDTCFDTKTVTLVTPQPEPDLEFVAEIQEILKDI